jgi:hypothetical protein
MVAYYSDTSVFPLLISGHPGAATGESSGAEISSRP